MKNLSLGPRLRLELRAEVYNALNCGNLGNPTTAPTNSAFGTITSQNGLPRQPRLAAVVRDQGDAVGFGIRDKGSGMCRF